MRKSALCAFGLVVAVLVALGFVVLSSASEANGIRLHHDAYHFMKRQFAYLGVGVVLAAVVASIDYRRWRDTPALTWIFYARNRSMVPTEKMIPSSSAPMAKMKSVWLSGR